VIGLNDKLYYYFEGLDESILLLNPYLKAFNFQFEKISISTLEADFKDFFVSGKYEVGGNCGKI
jgi:hypothetical protein